MLRPGSLVLYSLCSAHLTRLSTRTAQGSVSPGTLPEWLQLQEVLPGQRSWAFFAVNNRNGMEGRCFSWGSMLRRNECRPTRHRNPSSNPGVSMFHLCLWESDLICPCHHRQDEKYNAHVSTLRLRSNAVAEHSPQQALRIRKRDFSLG